MKLENEFKNTVSEIKISNYLYIVGKLADYYEAIEYGNGVNLPEFIVRENCVEKANNVFALMKKNGLFDELNNIIPFNPENN